MKYSDYVPIEQIDVTAAQLYFIPLTPLTASTDVLVSMLTQVVIADSHRVAPGPF